MNNMWIPTLLLASGLLGSAATATPQASAMATTEATATVTGSDWVVQSEDAVCGVSEAHQISNPAKVDYEALMKVTSEMKKLRKERIDKTSAEGLTLVTKARAKVCTAAKAVMKEKGYCSVWKKITHKKRQAVTDITAAVKKKLGA